jgi:putative hydrolase of the HAD superfamily
LVLFDLDDTLCDYAGARYRRLEQAFRQAFTSAAVPPPDDFAPLIAESIALHPHSTEHFAELLAIHGITAEEAVRAAREWYGQNRFHTLALFPDTVMTLETVRRLPGVERIGMITNGPTEVQRRKIELLGLEPYLDFILISEEFGCWKPDPAIFAEALRLGGATAGEAVFIGDSAEHDMTGAHAAGIASIWINPAGAGWHLPCPAPAHVVTSLAGVRELLGAR